VNERGRVHLVEKHHDDGGEHDSQDGESDLSGFDRSSERAQKQVGQDGDARPKNATLVLVEGGQFAGIHGR
jgi:hypothetical protein